MLCSTTSNQALQRGAIGGATSAPTNPPTRCSTQLHRVLIQEGVHGKLQILRSWPQAHTSCMVVVGTMARAEIATEVAGIWLGNATQVSAHTDDNQPLWLLAT